jgi:intein/homing endonuclease
MLISADFAEVLGVLLGDGCVCRYRSQGRYFFQTAFTASSSEYWYYEEFIKPTLERNCGVSGRLFLRNDNTTRYHISGLKLAAELIRLGIPVGKKRDASIPSCVLEGGQVIPFIRGIYHAEGSIYRRYSKRYNRHAKVYDNLLTIQIRMKLSTLMHQLREELTKLGISCNRLIDRDGVYTLRITSQLMVRKFLEIIQPRYKTMPHQANL